MTHANDPGPAEAGPMEPDLGDESDADPGAQLRAAEAGGSGGARISRSADLAGGRHAVVIAILLALYLLVVVYVYPREILWLDVAATAAFVAAMVGAHHWHERRRRASGLGWARRYSAGFVVSVLLFGLGMALLDLTDSRAAWLWVPYAAMTALPLVAVGAIRPSS